MDTPAIEDAVFALMQNRLKPGPFKSLPAQCKPSGLNQAYDLQEALNKALTKAGLGPQVGHKVGCTSKVMQDYMKIPHPCSGSIFQSTVHSLGVSQPSNLYHQVGVECEIAVRLAKDLPPSREPYTQSSVFDCVESCMSAIEIVDNRYQDFRSLDLETMVADDFFQAACVLGEELKEWQHLDLAEITGRMMVNKIEVGNGKGADILGHPFEALAWLANHKAARETFLCAGEIVLLGSLVKTQWLSPGDKAVIELDHLGTVSAEFIA